MSKAIETAKLRDANTLADIITNFYATARQNRMDKARVGKELAGVIMNHHDFVGPETTSALEREARKAGRAAAEKAAAKAAEKAAGGESGGEGGGGKAGAKA